MQLRDVRVALALAFGYALGSFAAFALFNASSAGAVFFPPAGLTLALLVVSERRKWPLLLAVIGVTEIVVDLSQGQQLRYVWGFAAANVVEPLIGAWLLTRRWSAGTPGAKRTALPIGAFLARAVVAGPLVGAALGTATVVWGQHKGSWSSVYGPFFAGDALAVLTIGGTLLTWWSSDPARRLPGIGCTMGVCAAVAAATVVGYWPASTPLFYLPLPLLAFAAVRYRSATLAGLASIVMALTANLMSALGHGPWAHVASRPHYGITTLQGFLAVSSLTAMWLAREVVERVGSEQRAVTERVQHSALRVLFDHAPCGVVATGLDGTIRRVNDTFVQMVGRKASNLVGTTRFSELLTVGGRLYYETHFWPLLRMHGAAQSIAFDLAAPNGERLPVLINADLSEADGAPDGILMAVFDARERRLYETELLAARRRAEGVAQQLDALQQLTARLSTAATTDDVAEAVIGEGVRLLETHAVLGVIDRRQVGMLRTWPTFGVDDPVVASLRYVPLSAPLPVTAVVRTGARLELLSRAEIESRFPECIVTLIDTDAKSMLGVPIHTDKECVGALMLGLPTEGRIDDAVVDNAQALATLIGAALERAWRYEHEYDSAHQLQQAFLPVIELPPGDVGVSAHYRPAFDMNDVGGDWYDAFMMPDGDLAIVVGDVVGHDLPAAAAMGRLQSAVRLLATASPDPAHLLGELDRAVAAIPGADFTTMVFGRLNLSNGQMRYASAGHPPPLLVGEAVELLHGGRGAPLGIPQQRTSASVEVPVGSHIVLYTDGLVETRGTPVDVSIRQLAGAAARLTIEPPADWCEGILRERCGPHQFDDVVLMCVTRTTHHQPETLGHVKR